MDVILETPFGKRARRDVTLTLSETRTLCCITEMLWDRTSKDQVCACFLQTPLGGFWHCGLQVTLLQAIRNQQVGKNCPSIF